MQQRFIVLFSFLVLCVPAFSQSAYPKITGYVSIVHPIITFSGQQAITNFKNYYVVGMPSGINIWKNSKVAFSMEFVPYIRAENGSSRMNNFLFHPGAIFALGKGYNFIGRAAFETAGRYGLTAVLNKTIVKSKNCSYFLAMPMPVRFGNDKPTSLTIGFQFGIAF